MKSIRCVFILFFALNISSLFSQEYVVMIAHNVNIRTKADINSYIVCRAEKGDIYHFNGEEGEYNIIQMISEDKRYVHKNVSAIITEFLPGHNMNPDKPESELKKLKSDIEFAIKRAKTEAGEIIPKSLDSERHNYYLDIRKDENVLYIFHQYGIQPALFDEVMK